MGVLINELEIVPPSEGESGQRPDEAAPQQTAEELEKLEARDVHRLIERREERLVRVWAH